MPDGAIERQQGRRIRSLSTAIILLAGWLGVGTLGFALIEDYPPMDALYMTVITLSTVGYAEVHPLTGSGRAFASALIVGGIGTVLYTLTRLGAVFVEGELTDLLERRRMARQISRIKDHYIVCGYGRTARPVTEGLEAEGVAFIVVERDPDVARDLDEKRLLHVVGEATDEDVLQKAGIERATGILALLPSDADNLYLTMTAKGLKADLRVIARASDEKSLVKLRRGGADAVIAPYKMAGERVVQAVVRPSALQFVELEGQGAHLHLSLEEVPVQEGSRLVGRTLAQANLREQTGTIPVAVRGEDGVARYTPREDETLAAGDTLVVLGRPEDLARLTQLTGPA